MQIERYEASIHYIIVELVFTALYNRTSAYYIVYTIVYSIYY